MTLNVNGSDREVNAPAEASLLEVLRNDLGLTGSKFGCGESECGACTVLLDGVPIHSCVHHLGDAVGKRVITIEGLEQNGQLHPLQQAFIDEDAMQCAYCGPGMIMSAYGLLLRNPHPTDGEILEHMEGNICRCGAYPRMLKAIKRATKSMEANP